MIYGFQLRGDMVQGTSKLHRDINLALVEEGVGYSNLSVLCDCADLDLEDHPIQLRDSRKFQPTSPERC